MGNSPVPGFMSPGFMGSGIWALVFGHWFCGPRDSQTINHAVHR
ncbi:hypothetical protein [Corynebacterium propinquum]|nr:hypothetical protein [Corynebacterium propinquum]MDK4239586.1 hypothetical protein [Corynebacterium propinquum]MDK4314398.1 hypothetical protein [Corynebacterium propinquum]